MTDLGEPDLAPSDPHCQPHFDTVAGHPPPTTADVKSLFLMTYQLAPENLHHLRRNYVSSFPGLEWSVLAERNSSDAEPAGASLHPSRGLTGSRGSQVAADLALLFDASCAGTWAPPPPELRRFRLPPECAGDTEGTFSVSAWEELEP